MYRDVLQEGGSAVDAAIAALFCDGVYNCQSMGLGGGFLMTIYSAKVSCSVINVFLCTKVWPGLFWRALFYLKKGRETTFGHFGG